MCDDTKHRAASLRQQSYLSSWHRRLSNLKRTNGGSDSDSAEQYYLAATSRVSCRINIMDNIMSMMEKYAYNLEEIVEERTQQLVEEKKKTDRLLYRMLPSYVVYLLCL